MKNNQTKIILVGVFMFLIGNLKAQETVTIPLTDSNKKGFLKVGIINGSISVEGYNGKEVEITGNVRENRRKKRKEEHVGLKRISAKNLEFSVEENDNNVIVKSQPMTTIDFKIKVPRNFSLKLATINNGEINVSNIKGVIEASNPNGKITMTDIDGSVSADAINGNIVVAFKGVLPNTPMAFSSLNGKIDITFPKNTKANIKMKSDIGEMFTDFNIKSLPQKKTKSKKKGKDGVYRVKVDKWIIGAINGGGPEFLFKNFNGDIILRSK